MWLRRTCLKVLVVDYWVASVSSCGMLTLSIKLRMLKLALCIWIQDTFGNVHNNLKSAELKVTHLEECFNSDPSNSNLIALNEANTVYLWSFSEEEEEDFWKQRSGIKRLQEGDAYICCFHKT